MVTRPLKLAQIDTIYAFSVYSQILFHICHCVEKRTPKTKKEAGFGLYFH